MLHLQEASSAWWTTPASYTFMFRCRSDYCNGITLVWSEGRCRPLVVSVLNQNEKLDMKEKKEE